MVASPSAINSEQVRHRRKFRDIISGFSNEEEKSKAPTRENDHVSSFLQTISPEIYRSTVQWILQITATRGLDSLVLIRYLQSFGKGTFRKKLRGWLAFYGYCNTKDISIDTIVQEDPIKLLSQFILFLKEKKLSDSAIVDAKSAVSTLLEDILGKSGLGKNKILSVLLIPEELHVPRKKKYSSIWDISLLFSYYRAEPVNSSLSNFDLMIKTVILILAFTACRPSEVVTIVPNRVQYFSESKSMLLPTIVKQHRNRITVLQIQQIQDEQICPVAATLEWLARLKTLHQSTFLLTKSGQPLTSAQLLSDPIRSVFDAASIPSFYRPYSIKHAVISALYHLGCTRTEVNIFTGHSELADTAPTFYLKSINEWLGYKLAARYSPGSSGVSVAPPENPLQ
jgi:site-specific recombinase XerD